MERVVDIEPKIVIGSGTKGEGMDASFLSTVPHLCM